LVAILDLEGTGVGSLGLVAVESKDTWALRFCIAFISLLWTAGKLVCLANLAALSHLDRENFYYSY